MQFVFWDVMTVDGVLHVKLVSFQAVSILFFSPLCFYLLSLRKNSLPAGYSILTIEGPDVETLEEL